MLDMAHEWRVLDAERRAPDTAAQWDERAFSYGGKGSHARYAVDFLRLAALSGNERVLDMGCGTGALAVPLALSGHEVIAADFSPRMLERMMARACAEGATGIEPLLMSWEDDWAAHGVGGRSVDVALASRSVITHDLADSLSKLSAAAREKVCVTAATGVSPRVDERVAEAMGLTLARRNDALYVFGIASQLGYEPRVDYIHSPRTRRYGTAEEAYHSLLRTIEYVDDAQQQVDEREAARRLRLWLDDHLVPAPEGAGVQLDEPRLVSWAFISWTV